MYTQLIGIVVLTGKRRRVDSRLRKKSSSSGSDDRKRPSTSMERGTSGNSAMAALRKASATHSHATVFTISRYHEYIRSDMTLFII